MSDTESLGEHPTDIFRDEYFKNSPVVGYIDFEVKKNHTTWYQNGYRNLQEELND